MRRSMLVVCLAAACGFVGLTPVFAQTPEGARRPAATPPQLGPKPLSEPAQPPASTPLAAEEYVVVKGDTLSGIAERLTGSENNWREIARVNGIEDPTKLEVGLRLKIPLPLRTS